MQLTVGPHGGLSGALALPSELRVFLSDDLVGPLEEPLPVAAGHAEHPGDHLEGKGCGEGVDEVALPDLATCRRPVDDVGGDPSDLVTRPGPLFGMNFLLASWRIGPCRGGSRKTIISYAACNPTDSGRA